MINVLIVDDSSVARNTVAKALSAEAGICVVGQASNGATGMERFRQLQPDVVVVDLEMPRVDGLDWQISKVLRDRVTFDRVPLQYPFPASMPQMDIVLLRNVIIYFDHATRSPVLGNIHRILQQDGVLILGGAETTFQLNHGFRRVELTKDKVFFQRTDARGGPNAGV